MADEDISQTLPGIFDDFEQCVRNYALRRVSTTAGTYASPALFIVSP